MLSSETKVNHIFSDFINVLDKNEIANIESGNWKKIMVNHSKTPDEPKRLKNKFKSKLKQDLSIEDNWVIRGIYVYYKDKECLYVGKSKNILNRLSDHFIEAQGFLGGDWGKFFSEHSDDLSVYILELDDVDSRKGEALRIIVERLLLILLKPKFEKFHNSIK